MDAAVGIVERGSWSVKDAVAEKNWLPNGPIRTHVDWRLDGYRRIRHSPAAAGESISSNGATMPVEDDPVRA